MAMLVRGATSGARHAETRGSKGRRGNPGENTKKAQKDKSARPGHGRNDGAEM